MRQFICRVGEGVVIGGPATVLVDVIEGEQVRLLIEAPDSVGMAETTLWERTLAAWEARLDQDRPPAPDRTRH